VEWLKEIVPLIGTALGGPLGGAAASFVASKLGLDSNTVEAVSDVLNSGKMTPEQISNLKIAEIEFQKFLEGNKIELARLDVDNTKSAREMQSLTKSNIPGLLSIIIVTGFFTILITTMLGWLKVSDNQSLLILLGALSAGFGSVLNFYFGSSHGSQNKDVLLSQSVPAKK